MNTKVKSILILLGTLLIGGVLGGTVVGVISQNRQEKRENLRGPGGFVRHMERVIGIEDSAQHAVVHPILEAADRRNWELLKTTREQMRASFDTMLVELSPHLRADQLENLKREREHMKKKMKGPPGLPGGPREKPDHPPAVEE